ncbi:MAG: aromatic amino acid hydroxylase [Pseudomonadota bacterium]
MTQQEVIESLPAHLRPFVKTQNYEDYTPRDHAVWRFVMKHLVRQLADSAHPVYRAGLSKTGITMDQVPSIEEMNRCLAMLGWRAVVVDGFLPPAIFMEFQSLKVLVIAIEMRSVEHIFYTPAPDIIHEAAGHAPFIVDVDYAEFLQRFGEVGMKAIATRHDLEQYEAIRKLSILKECPSSDPGDIAKAQAVLERLMKSDAPLSEAARLTRLHWWTVEYGLVGSVDDYRLFGAGLLSSLGESRHCLDDEAVKKVPLTVNAVEQPYDITHQQPTLFVTKSCKHLTQVLEEFAASMCYQRGGADSVRRAIDAESVCTVELDTGTQMSGRFSEVLCDAVGNATYVRTVGATQLAHNGTQIYGHGIEKHSHGFGSPIGYLKDFSRCLSAYTVDELKAHQIEVGKRVELEYLSGITVKGMLQAIVRQDQKNLVLSFLDCSVTDLDGGVHFAPDGGTYDLLVGGRITSVFGGAADRLKLQLFKPTPRTKTIQVEPDADLMEAYREVACINASNQTRSAAELPKSVCRALQLYPDEWLLRVELLGSANPALSTRLHGELAAISGLDEELVRLLALSPPEPGNPSFAVQEAS